MIHFVYVFILLALTLANLYKLVLVFLYFRNRSHKPRSRDWSEHELPYLTVQLPLYNERYVAERIIRMASQLDYPTDRLQIQVLDDSTDDTTKIAEEVVNDLKSKLDIELIHRANRKGFKAGALSDALASAKGEFIALFDADFVPPPNFLKKTLRYFVSENVGMVQTRWSFLNREHSLLTRIQAIFLDGHFVIEHTARNRAGFFFNFNGTAGIWRKACIESGGGWSADTLTEDLDLSYRCQLKGWQFVYLKDVAVPSELPIDLGAVKSQQFRWAKGMTQVARKMIWKIWKSPIPLTTKIDATFHLSSNLGFLYTTLTALLLIPHLLGMDLHMRESWLWLWVFLVSVNYFWNLIYYGISQWELGNRRLRHLFDTFCLMPLAVGLSLNGTGAVLEALFGKDSPFVRTPKFALREKKRFIGKRAYFSKPSYSLIGEWALALYFSWAIFGTSILEDVLLLPWLSLYLAGYLYLSLMGAFELFPRLSWRGSGMRP